MLDYKDIITKHYALSMSGTKIAQSLGVSKSGVNDFLRAFKECKTLSYPLPEGITNYGIAAAVYGKNPSSGGRDLSYEMPDYEAVHQEMSSQKNMTLVVLWNRYAKLCRDRKLKFYSYRQYCENYAKWCEKNKETLHFNAVIAQKMEVDFAGKTFHMVDPLTGEVQEIVVFVAILPYSQYIYAEGMLSTKEPQWIAVNNNALAYFGGVPALVVCDNCKQAVIANRDWVDPELNRDYAEWAEHNRTAILPAKVKKPRYKSSVENAVGILEKGFFHDMENMRYFSLEQFNRDLWKHLEELNNAPFKKKPYLTNFLTFQPSLMGTVRDALLHLLGQADYLSVSLRCRVPLQLAEREIPADLRQVSKEVIRFLGRNGFPCPHICITHTFFCILCRPQDFVGDRIQLAAINCIRLLNRIFVSFPEQRYNLRIGHEVHLRICIFLNPYD